MLRIINYVMVSEMFIFNPYLGMIGPSDSYFSTWVENTN